MIAVSWDHINFTVGSVNHYADHHVDRRLVDNQSTVTQESTDTWLIYRPSVGPYIA